MKTAAKVIIVFNDNCNDNKFLKIFFPVHILCEMMVQQYT